MNKTYYLVESLTDYTREFRRLVNDKLQKVFEKKETKQTDESYHDIAQKSLRLNKKEDWNFIVTAMDIIGDTSLAIGNFLEFGLDGTTKDDSIGERYLRLYGVLNASYMQQRAVLNLCKIVNISGFEKIKKQINDLEIFEVRNKIGSHSNDYLNNGKVESYEPIQISLHGYGFEYINNETLEKQTVNLFECLIKHLEVMVELVDQIYAKAGKTIYKSNPEKIDSFTSILKELRIKKNDGMVFKSQDPQIGDVHIKVQKK